MEGHDFFGWDLYISVALADTTITAIYEVHTFTVKFYGYDRKLVDEQVMNHHSPQHME